MAFYDIPYNGTVSSASEIELAADLAARLQTAVQRQLVADVPVGAFLSGGLDSSAIVAMMRRAVPDQPITCFSIGFRDDVKMEGNLADRPDARRVARHLGWTSRRSRWNRPPSVVSKRWCGCSMSLRRILLDQRAHDCGASPGARYPGAPFRCRRRRSVRRLPPASGSRVRAALAWLPRGIRRGVQAIASAGAGGSGPRQALRPLRRLTKMFAHAGEDRDRRLHCTSGGALTWFAARSTPRNLPIAWLRSTRQLRCSKACAGSPETDRLQRMLYLEGRHFLADHNLNYTDRAGMAVGVEVRVPLLDRDLVQFATRIPARFKQRGRVGKAIFKRSMEPYLPRDVIYRPKTGFGAPLRRWLSHELRPMVDDTLEAGSLRRRGFFDPTAVRRLIELDRAGRIDGSYTIFALMCIELWCRRFLSS